MNREDQFRDQADRLRKRIETLNETALEEPNLPPRGDLHRNRKKKTKWKIKYPVIRSLVLFFFLLLITIFSYYSYFDGKKYGGTEMASSDTKGYEPIKFVKAKKSEAVTSGNNQKITGNSSENSGLNEIKGRSEETAAPKNTINKEEPGQTTGSTETTNKQKAPKNNTPTENNPKVEQKSTKIIYHTVNSNETLYHIAILYYHSPAGIDIIKKANHLQDNNIVEGSVLKIPVEQ